jgi:hypothetical protein
MFVRFGEDAQFNVVSPIFPEGLSPRVGEYFWREHE